MNKIEFYKETNFKETSIGKIPKDWESLELGEIIEVFDSERIPLSEMERSKRKGPYPYCGATGIIDWIDGYIFDGEYILLVEDGGPFGKFEKKAYIMSGKFWVNNHAHVLKAVKDKGSNYFLLYLLNYLDLNQYTVGSTRKKLNQEHMKQIIIPLPPIEEQKAVAEVLSTVDEAVQKTNEIIAKTERLKKGLMQTLLTKGIGHKEFKDIEIGRIPKEWEVVKLKDVADIIMGQSPPSTTYNKEGIGLPFLQGKMEFGEVYPSPVMFCSNPLKIAEVNDILISVRAPVGDINLAPYKLCIGRGLAAIRFKREAANYLFYFYYLQKVKSFLEMLGKGSTFKAIVKEDLENLKVPLVPPSEQEKIAEILSTVDKKLELERKEKARLERIKQGLMDLLLTGKVRVRVN
ncbi:MAG: restriction endonuclease subunit S [Nitrososphaerota archaeon]